MRWIILYATLIILGVTGCAGPSHTTGNKGQGVTGTGDIIIPRVEAKSFQKELAGTWAIISMRRQQKAPLETLSGVQLTFSATEMKFTGKAPCNNLFGTIMLKGYSIRFQNMGTTRMTCDQLELETAFIALLQSRISAFTLEGDRLYLRDGISNIVFEGTRLK